MLTVCISTSPKLVYLAAREHKENISTAHGREEVASGTQQFSGIEQVTCSPATPSGNVAFQPDREDLEATHSAQHSPLGQAEISMHRHALNIHLKPFSRRILEQPHIRKH